MTRTIRTILSAATLLCAATAFAATVTGTVTDRTTGKPSAGDTIAVINTAVSMDEIAKATSDAKGSFHVDVPDGGQVLLHITHAGAEYFKSVPPGASSVDIDVYDSAAKVDGISGEALVMRAETDPTGKLLTVAENFFVANTSNPPRTQFGGNTFEFYLPKGAQILETVASAPGGLPTNSKVKALDEAAGHYAFTFPVRPGGDTRFQVEYTLPYSGRQAFSLKLSVPTGDVAVMLPRTMQFESSEPFQAINDPQVKTPTYDDHQPTSDKPLEFAVTGTGQLPEDNTQGGAGDGDQIGQQAASGQRPGGGLGVPVDPGDENAPLSKYKWWIVGGLGLALAAGAGIMLKNAPTTVSAGAAPSLDHGPDFANLDVTPRQTPAAFLPAAHTASAPARPGGPSSLLQGLRDELFELETDRIAGRITPEQYADQKAAFDVVLKRALSRIES